jgi:hypothetical protein
MHLSTRLPVLVSLWLASAWFTAAWAQLLPLPKGPGTPQNLMPPVASPAAAPVVAKHKISAGALAPGTKDGLNDMSTEQQLKMQRTMDQRGKALESTSNVIKKNGDTSSTINQNLK